GIRRGKEKTDEQIHDPEADIAHPPPQSGEFAPPPRPTELPQGDDEQATQDHDDGHGSCLERLGSVLRGDITTSARYTTRCAVDATMPGPRVRRRAMQWSTVPASAPAPAPDPI